VPASGVPMVASRTMPVSAHQVGGAGIAIGADPRQPWHRQRRRTAAQRSVVWHPQRHTERADDRADQALGLSVGEAEHRA
jgi:hypothetical protein